MTASYKRNNNVVSVLCDSKSYTRDRDRMLSWLHRVAETAIALRVAYSLVVMHLQYTAVNKKVAVNSDGQIQILTNNHHFILLYKTWSGSISTTISVV